MESLLYVVLLYGEMNRWRNSFWRTEQMSMQRMKVCRGHNTWIDIIKYVRNGMDSFIGCFFSRTWKNSSLTALKRCWSWTFRSRRTDGCWLREHLGIDLAFFLGYVDKYYIITVFSLHFYSTWMHENIKDRVDCKENYPKGYIQSVARNGTMIAQIRWYERTQPL